MERTTIDLWVGIFVALGVAALIGLATKVGNLTTSHIGETYNVTANFENIGGLKPRAPVKSAGVVVGPQHGEAQKCVGRRLDGSALLRIAIQ